MTKTAFMRSSTALAFLLAPAAALSQASPSAYTTGVRYDAANRVTGTIAPDPDGAGPLHYAAVRNTYDSAGRQIKVESGELAVWKSEAVAPSAWGADFTVLKTVDTTFDALDRKTKETVTGSDAVIAAVTQYSYNSDGLLECTAVRMNPAVFGSLPSSACTLGTEGTRGPDRITRNIYDAAGQLLQVRKGVGTGNEAAEATYSYTPGGNKEYVIDANGNRAQLRYDAFARQDRWIFPSTTRPTAYSDATVETALTTAGSTNASDYEEYSYDANNNRTSLRKRDGSTLTYSYDALNRMTLKVVPERNCPAPQCLASAATRDVYYDYDLRGFTLRSRFDSLSGDGLTTAYNGFGDLTSSQIVMGTLNKTISYTWDKEGHRLEVTHPDGQKFTYTRDGLGRLANIYEGTSQVSSAQLVQATFNARSLIAGLQRSTGVSGFTAGYSYDSVGRLTSIANEAVGTSNDLTLTQGFNPASQIISQSRNNDSYSWTGSVTVNRTYTTNGLNQYTAAATANFCYDANGNLIADGSSVYVYDVENRLLEKRAQLSGSCPSTATDYTGTLQASLTYDPMGRLWQVTGPSSNNRFLYDGDELVTEYDYAGNVANRYVHSDNVDDPMVLYDGASVGTSYRTFLMPDERGSTAGLFYNDGSIRAKLTYDEYGIPGQYNLGRFQYTGQAWIPELGMYYYKARIYSPTLGRFLQTDPIGYKDQVNLYAYAGSDPINGRDSSGLATTCDRKVCTMTADTYSSTQTNQRTIKATPEVKTAVQAKASDYRVKSGPDETHGWVKPDAAGNPVVDPPSKAATGNDIPVEGLKVKLTVPDDAMAGVHGHIEGGEFAQNGFVDEPTLNGGYGDTEALRYGKPYATEFGGQVSWHEMDKGQLTFTFPEGSMSKGQMKQMQTNLNNEQKLFRDRTFP